MMGIDAEMFVRTKEAVTDEQVLQWAIDLHEAFGEFVFVIHRDAPYAFGGDRHCLEIVDAYYQDGPQEDPADGETFIRAHLYTRYYGKNYERGDLPRIIAVARWLEDRIPGAEVWYGGDSSGVPAEPFGQEERDALWAHFVKVGHRPYTHAGFIANRGDIAAPTCGLCKIPMRCYGIGKNYGAFICDGCGWKLTTRDGGKTFEHKKD